MDERLRDISTEELIVELKQREGHYNSEHRKKRELAHIASAEFMKREWPTYGRARLVALLSFFLAMIGTAMTERFLDPLFRFWFGEFFAPAMTVVLVFVFVFLLTPVIHAFRKESRLIKRFIEKHPGHRYTP